MTEIQERRISHKELVVLAFQCKHCRGELVIDLRSEKQRERLFHSASTPMVCPFCGVEFDRLFHQSFQGLRDWLERLKEAGQEVFFCLRESGSPSERRASR